MGAQMPLIISSTINTFIDKFIVAAEIIEYLEVNIHFKIDEKKKNVILTEQGTTQIESILGSDDLHKAVEAKENLPIRENTQTVASITYQNFFLLYPKLSGMTGTGKTAELEFEKIYKLSVDEIPTARPVCREDLPDFIYKDQLSKWNAIAKECKNISNFGQPILIGTTT